MVVNRTVIIALAIVAFMWMIAMAALVLLSLTHGNTEVISNSITAIISMMVGVFGGLGFHAVQPTNGHTLTDARKLETRTEREEREANDGKP